ncbi:hypothetical protein [Janibacter sp. G1551]|uniref:hypothetical protein n=1 Tax=Janibacter sp. G1551 TaxID=3420440 RepID=UPI003CFED72C
MRCWRNSAAAGWTRRTRPSARRLGPRWQVTPSDPFLAELDRAWEACDHAGIDLDEERMDRYADQVEGVARIDVATVPPEPAAAVRQVVLGTILVDPVLTALRRSAQQHVSRGADPTRSDAHGS